MLETLRTSLKMFTVVTRHAQNISLFSEEQLIALTFLRRWHFFRENRKHLGSRKYYKVFFLLQLQMIPRVPLLVLWYFGKFNSVLKFFNWKISDNKSGSRQKFGNISWAKFYFSKKKTNPQCHFIQTRKACRNYVNIVKGKILA